MGNCTLGAQVTHNWSHSSGAPRHVWREGLEVSPSLCAPTRAPAAHHTQPRRTSSAQRTAEERNPGDPHPPARRRLGAQPRSTSKTLRALDCPKRAYPREICGHEQGPPTVQKRHTDPCSHSALHAWFCQTQTAPRANTTLETSKNLLPCPVHFFP